MILALTFTSSLCLCLALLRPTETSLMVWLYGNGFIKKAALLFLALAGILHKNS